MSFGVLIIEDEAVLAKKIAKFLQRQGFEVRVAGNGRDGLDTLKAFLPDAVVLDFNLPGEMNGLEVLKRIRSFDPGIKVVMVTGQGNVRLAVDAMKAGAFDYLSKPVVLSELTLLIDRAIGQNRTEGQLHYFREKQATAGSLDQIIGDCDAIRAMKAQLSRIIEAAGRLREGTPPTVLVTGETGTGKELVARALHFGGPRSGRPFVELNVATIPSQLVESELFGHERGAFTDARERKFGLVEAADGGTLFLDEIGELDLPAQAKLLKLLEDRTVRRLGSVRDHVVDIQVVTATNRSLSHMVAEGSFREDLYYRLNMITVEVPPLRARDGDILTLARHFLATFGTKYAKPGLTLDDSACVAIMGHPWPGNVRELRNVMEQAVLHCEAPRISAAELAFPKSAAVRLETAPGPAAAGNDRVPPGTTLEAVERDLIERTLREVDGNVSKAARRLGITRDRLRYRIEKHGL
jgi:DNA-binding NtrC family response regulator